MCKDAFEGQETVRLKCGHYFHGLCGQKWYGSQTPCLCPLCRERFVIEHYFDESGSTQEESEEWKRVKRAAEEAMESESDMDTIFWNLIRLLPPHFFFPLELNVLNGGIRGSITVTFAPLRLHRREPAPEPARPLTQHEPTSPATLFPPLHPTAARPAVSRSLPRVRISRLRQMSRPNVPTPATEEAASPPASTRHEHTQTPDDSPHLRPHKRSRSGLSHDESVPHPRAPSPQDPFLGPTPLSPLSLFGATTSPIELAPRSPFAAHDLSPSSSLFDLVPPTPATPVPASSTLFSTPDSGLGDAPVPMAIARPSFQDGAPSAPSPSPLSRRLRQRRKAHEEE